MACSTSSGRSARRSSDGAAFEAKKADREVRRFYEETGRYDLDVWSALRDAAGKVVHTGWYRRVKESGVVIYTGFYTTVQPPGHGSRCVKVKHLRSLHEHFEVYQDEGGELRCNHLVRFLGMSMLRLHYRMRERTHSPGPDACAS